MYLTLDGIASAWNKKLLEKWIGDVIMRMMSSYLAQVWKVGQIYSSVSFIFSAQESGHLRFNSS